MRQQVGRGIAVLIGIRTNGQVFQQSSHGQIPVPNASSTA
jgi:hypothetical protein